MKWDFKWGGRIWQNGGSWTELSISLSSNPSGPLKVEADIKRKAAFPGDAQPGQARDCTGVVELEREAESGRGLEFSVRHKCAHCPRPVTQKPQKGQWGLTGINNTPLQAGVMQGTHNSQQYSFQL